MRVLVVGEVYYDEFLRLAEELGVAEHVVVTGRVPHAEVPDYLAAATVESHDLDGHGLGITTMEVMAARVPVFARVRRDVFPGIDLDQWPELQIVESAEPDGDRRLDLSPARIAAVPQAGRRSTVRVRQPLLPRRCRGPASTSTCSTSFAEHADDPSSAAIRGAAGYFLALLVVVTTWAVGIPRFASPDEPAHIYKAYGTAHGELLGAPAPGLSRQPARVRRPRRRSVRPT